MTGLILSTVSLGLETRCKRVLDNSLNRDPPTDGMTLQVEAHKREYANATHRPVGPCSSYNCHGLTFAARRTWIADPAVVERSIEDDDYEPVPLSAVLPGDIAVYRGDGDIEHSGIVIEKTPLVPRILSKWGQCHEVIHFATDCPYSGPVTYYRIAK